MAADDGEEASTDGGDGPDDGDAAGVANGPADGAGGRSERRGDGGALANARVSARNWAPYVSAAAFVFLAAAVTGAVTGASEPSAFVPEVGASGGDAFDSFVYLLSIAAVMIVGAGFVALPTIALLGLQGYQFGGSLATLAAGAGTIDALVAAAPAAVLALPALWLVAAIPLRALHYAARAILETTTPAVRTERLVGESVALAALAVLALWVAVTMAAGGGPA